MDGLSDDDFDRAFGRATPGPAPRPGPTPAPPPPRCDPSQIERLLDAIEIDKLIDGDVKGFMEQVKLQFLPDGPEDDPRGQKARAVLERALRTRISELRERIAALYAGLFTPEEVATLLDLYASPAWKLHDGLRDRLEEPVDAVKTQWINEVSASVDDEIGKIVRGHADS